MAAAHENDLLTEQIIGFAIEVRRHLGPGLLESVYEECLCYELAQNGTAVRRQVPLPVVYKAVRLDCGYRMDVVVDGRVCKNSMPHCLIVKNSSWSNENG